MRRRRLRLATQHLEHVGTRQPGRKAEDVFLDVGIGEPSDGRVDNQVHRVRHLDILSRDERVGGNDTAIEPDRPPITLWAFVVRDHQFVFANIFAIYGLVTLTANGRERLCHRVYGDCLGVCKYGMYS